MNHFVLVLMFFWVFFNKKFKIINFMLLLFRRSLTQSKLLINIHILQRLMYQLTTAKETVFKRWTTCSKFTIPKYFRCCSLQNLCFESENILRYFRTIFHEHSNWVFHDRLFCQIISQILAQGRAKKFVKNCPQWSLKPGPADLQANAVPTEISQHSVPSLNLHSLYKVMLYWF